MKRKRTPRRRSWSHLSQCLLKLILKPLTLPDRVRFGSVCRSWRRAQLDCLDAPAPPLPSLILSNIIEDEEVSIELFSFSDKRLYKLPQLPAHLLERCASSPQSWLLSHSFPGLIFFNPFSKECVQIHLKNYGFRDWLFFSTRSYPNGILFYSESGTNRFLVCSFCYLMTIERRYMKLWEKDVVSNVILCGKKLYALYEDGSLAVVDVSKLPPRVTNENMMELQREYSPLYQLRFIVRGIYVLVESCGEILMVLIKPFKKFERFHVLRADLTKKEWVEVKDLGDRMLFITDHGRSVSVSARETGGKGNIIYYIPCTDKFFEGRYMELDLNTKRCTNHQIPADSAHCLASLSPGMKRRRIPPRHSWSHLSQCLLELILKPLTLPDRVRFGSVCCSWRRAQLECLHAPAPPLPFLIIADIIIKDKNDVIQLFSFSDKRTYKLSSLQAHLAERYASSSQGWLLTNSPRGLVLFNPFSKTSH
ncbi:F-box/kelch-repeat-like protein [Cinnamomum micranthum f. kanehirae]|uniref:F-box/kelch-repeat-like protein n=1 Tax=Cinnamomum micranthum f. kanehirae TaxID=337451 RepID=A0A443NSC5_9MAGN|nr:F-box/kelch-repeat-like protein [Cinnamomum micranthum f. kanehirae]